MILEIQDERGLAGSATRYKIQLSPVETREWAERSCWSCSVLKYHQFTVEVDANGLLDYTGPELDDQAELVAIVTDHLPDNLKHLWPTWERSIKINRKPRTAEEMDRD